MQLKTFDIFMRTAPTYLEILKALCHERIFQSKESMLRAMRFSKITQHFAQNFVSMPR